MFPPWLKKRIPKTSTVRVNNILDKNRMHTVCESARCPNRSECFSKGKATFLILGDTCSRSCTYCSISHGKPKPVDSDEPRRLADSAYFLGLKHVVITSVTRDDLPDGGAEHFSKTVDAVKKRLDGVSIEVLTPDFMGNLDSVSAVCESEIDIFNHNLETVKRLYHEVRPGADYNRSLNILKFVRQNYPHILTKSGIMVGLGEDDHEVLETLNDLRKVNCDIVTIGQYLRPCQDKLEVHRFVTPDKFKYFEKYAQEIGFAYVSSGPFVRSSYNADNIIKAIKAQTHKFLANNMSGGQGF